ncbi:EAL domain-containing protein [Marinobacterium zhoushanense]|uniref:EAL domain-containing protein n=2 Tax=Marinobacterium zhoushanense TaxID=1679163 RepID=A0ABQ1K189_9GAMM|nr:EAL domain-containing protein [Marinobacterium zhoushanense]
MLQLDRLCRALHMENFAHQNTEQQWLFLNLNSQLLISEQPDSGFTRRMLEENAIPAHRIVIEVLENQIQDLGRLKGFIDHLRALGCLIAVDDFGAGSSNFDRIWQLEPDIVKIDRQLVLRAAESSRVGKMLGGIIDLLHGAGSQVVLEGIETEQQAMLAIAANADMVQGYYFAKPEPRIANRPGDRERFNHLLKLRKTQRTQLHYAKDLYTQALEYQFRRAAQQYRLSQDFSASCNQLLQEPNTLRCYLLDESGEQVHSGITPRHIGGDSGRRFAPLQHYRNASWSHRPYHYLALESPGQTQISQPYLSITDSRLCITLSQAIDLGNRLSVFCCDFLCPEE